MTIEYDYVIERDEENETKIYKPDKIPKILPGIAYIKGPNSAGKSTLLNLIALGFYGSNNDKLPKSLKEKIDGMKNRKDQKIKFDIKIYDKEHNLILESRKSNFDSEIEVYSYGKKVDADRFYTEYNLIYDIPENPTGRLKDLNYEVKDLQHRYMRNIGILETYIREIIAEVESGKDPQKIEKLKNEIRGYEEERERRIEKKNDLDNETKDLEIYVYTKLATGYKSKVEDIDKKLKNLKKDKRKIKKQNEEAYEIWNEVKTDLEEIEKLYSGLSLSLYENLPEGQKYRLDLWNKMDFHKILISRYVDPRSESQILDIKEIFDDLRKKLGENGASIETELCERLLGVLSEFKEYDIKIPGYNMNVREFTRSLEDYIEKNRTELKKTKDVEKICTRLDDLYNKLQEVKEKIKIIENTDREFDPTTFYSSEKIENIENSLENEKREYEKKYDGYKSHCISSLHLQEDDIKRVFESKRDKYSDLRLLDEDSLISRLTEQKKKRKDAEDNVNEIEVFIKEKTRELNDLENRKPHKYQDHKEDLNRLLRTCGILKNKLAKYDEYIDKIIKGEKPKSDNEKDAENYLEKLSTYLAKRMDTIRHIDRVYKVKKIDVIDEIVITEEGKRIRFEDFGTGQSQSAYLGSILNTNDKRKMIVLLDEVAMMDKTSLKPVFDKMRDLYKRGQLVMGIIVQIETEGNVEVKDVGEMYE